MSGTCIYTVEQNNFGFRFNRIHEICSSAVLKIIHSMYVLRLRDQTEGGRSGRDGKGIGQRRRRAERPGGAATR